jgi:phosphatidylinositol alpha-1,6-mannosyltransferase
MYKIRNSRAKILLTTPFYLPSIGGVQFILYNVCKRLPPSDIIVLRSRSPLKNNATEQFNLSQSYQIYENPFFTPSPNPADFEDGSDDKKEFINASIINRLFFKSKALRILYFLFSIFTILMFAKKKRINILWCGYPDTRSLIAGLIARTFFQIPFFVSTYGEELPPMLARTSFPGSFINRIRRYGLTKAEGTFTLSSFSQKWLMKVGVNKKRIHIIPPGVDLENFIEKKQKISQLKAQLGLNNKKVILSIGNITPRKGIDQVVKAVAELRKKIPNVMYLVVGKFIGDEKQKIKKLIRNYDLHDTVIFTGEISQDLIASYFYLCDVFCLYTRENKEGFGIVFIEAGACRRPVVGVATGGVTDAVIHQDNGLLVNFGDKNGFQRALHTILTNKHIAKEFGANGYRIVQRKYQWDRQVDKIQKILTS